MEVPHRHVPPTVMANVDGVFRWVSFTPWFLLSAAGCWQSRRFFSLSFDDTVLSMTLPLRRNSGSVSAAGLAPF